MTVTALYIHVPFCFSKCDYCGFYSIVPKESYVIDRYLDHLEKTMEKWFVKADCQIKTFFVGGGNPTMLGLKGIRRIMAMLSDHMDLAEVEEITFETNPETLSDDIVAFLAEYPQIRISMGIQRLQNDELELLGRNARISSVVKALDTVFNGITNVSADFIMGVPGCRSIGNDLQRLVGDYPFKHISAYFLSVEEGTPLQQKVDTGKLQDPDDIGPEEMFDVAEVLKGAGFEHYEISNYAKPGCRCKHNLAYWENLDYIGFGPAAVSCINNVRYTEKACFEQWLNGIAPDKELLSSKDQRNEYLMLHLRLPLDGLDLDVFEKKFGIQRESFYINLNKYVATGEIIMKDRCIRLSDLGIVMANNIISDLFA